MDSYVFVCYVAMYKDHTQNSDSFHKTRQDLGCQENSRIIENNKQLAVI